MYKLAESGSIIRISDSAVIPANKYNNEYLLYLDWVALGNTPAPIFSVAELLSNAKATKKAELELAYVSACCADITYNSVVYQGNKNTKVKLEDAISYRASGGVLPAGFTWRAKDNTNVSFSYADIDALVVLIGTNNINASNKLHIKKDALINATTIAAVNAIIW